MKREKKRISVITGCFNEEENVKELYEQVKGLERRHGALIVARAKAAERRAAMTPFERLDLRVPGVKSLKPMDALETH